MLISGRKHSFLDYGLEKCVRREVKILFPFDMKHLNMGLKYLSYYLKPNNYLKEDWMWLVRKVQKRINQWCNRWMSLRGRLMLVKLVLVNIPVYWLSFTKIPSFILEIIRRKYSIFFG